MSTPKEVFIDKALVYYGWTKPEFMEATPTESDIQELADLVNAFCDTPVTAACIVTRLAQIRAAQEKLEALKLVPRIEQRSAEWYAIRKTLITASDLAQALGHGKFGTARDIIIKKSGYKEEAPFNGNLPPLLWGVKYEDVIIAIYSHRNQVKVHDFGLIPHPTVPHFSASPDGISDLSILIEAKAPFRRLINGTIPEQYYYQIQGQLDVCDLEECDFVEAELSEYDNIRNYEQDTCPTSPGLTADRMYKGIIIELPRGDNPSSFIYSPLCLSPTESNAWIETEIAKLGDDANFNISFWRLDKYHCKRVFRDREFMAARFVELEQVWSRIQAYKADLALYQKEIESVTPPVPAKRGARKVYETITLPTAFTPPKVPKGCMFLDD
jgi:putative phage-type endonuclease